MRTPIATPVRPRVAGTVSVSDTLSPLVNVRSSTKANSSPSVVTPSLTRVHSPSYGHETSHTIRIMTRITTLLSLCLAAAPVLAQSAAVPAPITANEIDGHLRFLSSDLLEGRAPATRGGRLAAEYIAAQLRIYGVEPGVNGSYFQQVPIDIVGANRP